MELVIKISIFFNSKNFVWQFLKNDTLKKQITYIHSELVDCLFSFSKIQNIRFLFC